MPAIAQRATAGLPVANSSPRTGQEVPAGAIFDFRFSNFDFRRQKLQPIRGSHGVVADFHIGDIHRRPF
jgi:hypothetical protein